MSENKILTGYPSIDKPWLKYYSDDAITAKLPDCSVFELMYNGNKNYPNDTALNYYGHKITYQKLFDEIDRTAKAFSAIGVKKGDVVAICSVNTPETVYSFYALNRLGAISNMIDPRTNVETVCHYLKECNVRFVVTINAAYPLFDKIAKETNLEKIISVSPSDYLLQPKKFLYELKNKAKKISDKGISWKQFISLGHNKSFQHVFYEKDRCCVIAHTGGTTGTPKSVMLSDKNINAVTHGYKYIGIPFERKHRFFNDLPPFIMYGLCLATHTTLCYGLEVILYPIFDSKNFPKQFAKYKPHHFSALPDHLKYMSEDSATKNIDLSYFITAAVGGDSVSRDLEESCNYYLHSRNCNYDVVKGYGMTELSATAITSCPKANAIGSVGIPLVSNTVKIVDCDTFEELPYNKTGEIWISGPSIMLGYNNMEKETNDVIITDDEGLRWIRTGDLGHLTKDGLLYHEGRIRRIYITSFDGQPAKIFPLLVEEKIKSSEYVHDCVVVGRLKEKSANYESVAFVILKNNYVLSEEIITSFDSICKKDVPSYMRPVKYQFVSEFPHTPIGKVDFVSLEKEAIKL